MSHPIRFDTLNFSFPEINHRETVDTEDLQDEKYNHDILYLGDLGKICSESRNYGDFDALDYQVALLASDKVKRFLFFKLKSQDDYLNSLLIEKKQYKSLCKHLKEQIRIYKEDLEKVQLPHSQLIKNYDQEYIDQLKKENYRYHSELSVLNITIENLKEEIKEITDSFDEENNRMANMMAILKSEKKILIKEIKKLRETVKSIQSELNELTIRYGQLKLIYRSSYLTDLEHNDEYNSEDHKVSNISHHSDLSPPKTVLLGNISTLLDMHEGLHGMERGKIPLEYSDSLKNSASHSTSPEQNRLFTLDTCDSKEIPQIVTQEVSMTHSPRTEIPVGNSIRNGNNYRVIPRGEILHHKAKTEGDMNEKSNKVYIESYINFPPSETEPKCISEHILSDNVKDEIVKGNNFSPSHESSYITSLDSNTPSYQQNDIFEPISPTPQLHYALNNSIDQISPKYSEQAFFLEAHEDLSPDSSEGELLSLIPLHIPNDHLHPYPKIVDNPTSKRINTEPSNEYSHHSVPLELPSEGISHEDVKLMEVYCSPTDPPNPNDIWNCEKSILDCQKPNEINPIQQPEVEIYDQETLSNDNPDETHSRSAPLTTSQITENELAQFNPDFAISAPSSSSAFLETSILEEHQNSPSNSPLYKSNSQSPSLKYLTSLNTDHENVKFVSNREKLIGTSFTNKNPESVILKPFLQESLYSSHVENNSNFEESTPEMTRGNLDPKMATLNYHWTNPPNSTHSAKGHVVVDTPPPSTPINSVTYTDTPAQIKINEDIRGNPSIFESRPPSDSLLPYETIGMTHRKHHPYCNSQFSAVLHSSNLKDETNLDTPTICSDLQSSDNFLSYSIDSNKLSVHQPNNDKPSNSKYENRQILQNFSSNQPDCSSDSCIQKKNELVLSFTPTSDNPSKDSIISEMNSAAISHHLDNNKVFDSNQNTVSEIETNSEQFISTSLIENEVHNSCTQDHHLTEFHDSPEPLQRFAAKLLSEKSPTHNFFMEEINESSLGSSKNQTFDLQDKHDFSDSFPNISSCNSSQVYSAQNNNDNNLQPEFNPQISSHSIQEDKAPHLNSTHTQTFTHSKRFSQAVIPNNSRIPTDEKIISSVSDLMGKAWSSAQDGLSKKKQAFLEFYPDRTNFMSATLNHFLSPNEPRENLEILNRQSSKQIKERQIPTSTKPSDKKNIYLTNIMKDASDLGSINFGDLFKKF